MTIVTDSDFLSYFQAHAMQSTGGKLEDSSKQEYVIQLLNQLSSFMKRYFNNEATSIYFCFDEGKSWRYKYLEDLGIKYKDRDGGKRQLTPMFGDYRREFRKALLEVGYPVVALPGYEADDCMHLLVDMLQDSQVCMLTGDSDSYHKLLSTQDKEIFIMNPLDKNMPFIRSVHQPTKQQVEVDFFEDAKPPRFIDKVQSVKVVDPAHKLFIKVVSGDSSDTIPSAFRHQKITVGETRAETLFRECSLQSDGTYCPGPTVEQIRRLYLSKEERIEFAKWVISTTKLKALDKIDIFEQGLYRNTKCILLDDITYEPETLKILKATVQSIITKRSPGTDIYGTFRGTAYDLSKGAYNYYRN